MIESKTGGKNYLIKLADIATQALIVKIGNCAKSTLNVFKHILLFFSRAQVSKWRYLSAND